MKIEIVPEVITEYSLIGCQTGCTHYSGTHETRELRTSQVDWTKYISVQIYHSCAMSSECAKRRAAIYERAQAAADAVPYTFGGNVSRMVTKRRKVWQEITDEYVNAPCPFFVAVET